MFRDPFTSRLQGDKLKKEIMHGPQSLHGGAFQEITLFFFFTNIHDRFLHGDRLSNTGAIYKAILGTSRTGREQPRQVTSKWALKKIELTDRVHITMMTGALSCRNIL